jgi:hypothetical protein
VSGSSEVEVRSRYFAARFESVRKIIEDPDDERRWHADWRARAEARLLAVRAALEKRMPRLLGERALRLARYDDTLVEVCGSPPPEMPAGPVRCSYSMPRPFGLTITVTFKRFPGEPARDALGEKLAAIVSDIESP